MELFLHLKCQTPAAVKLYLYKIFCFVALEKQQTFLWQSEHTGTDKYGPSIALKYENMGSAPNFKYNFYIDVTNKINRKLQL